MRNSIRKNSNQDNIALFVAILVLFDGVLFIMTTLYSDLILRNADRSTPFTVDISILIGITLVYLSTLLIRKKQTAWFVVFLVYAFYLGISITQLHLRLHYYDRHLMSLQTFRDVYLPVIIILGLIIGRKSFTVKSDITNFGQSLRIFIVVFLIALIYGIAGYQLMDKTDFHKEINFTASVRATFDQLNLASSNQLTPYTRRARLFDDSLDVIAIAAVGYALLSLFQPIKSKLVDQEYNRETTRKLLGHNSGTSEDFFKLWPHDKIYYFNANRTAGLAYRVHRGIALVAGDPFGAVSEFKNLLIDFSEYCRINDWQPSFVHTEPHFNGLYKSQGFMMQKIGEEAVLKISHFESSVKNNKYFRHIRNKFEKQGYTIDVLKPPHSRDDMMRLKQISDDWLTLPGRSERGFLMGYFTFPYIQQCNIIVLRDKEGVIQAFLNQIKSYDATEANYDMLRHSSSSLGNSNDYILMGFIEYAKKEGFRSVNLGLCPLVGLDKTEESRTIIDNALSFLYANGDRLYSFSGLYKFKQKYEPEWSDRYTAYKKGVRGITRTIGALNVAMKPHARLSRHVSLRHEP